MSSTGPHNMANFGLLAADIGWPVWGTPPNFNGLRVLAALLHSSKVVSVSQRLRHRTEGATYVRQGDHHVGHWPTFLVLFILLLAGVKEDRNNYIKRNYCESSPTTVGLNSAPLMHNAELESRNYSLAVVCPKDVILQHTMLGFWMLKLNPVIKLML